MARMFLAAVPVAVIYALFMPSMFELAIAIFGAWWTWLIATFPKFRESERKAPPK